MLCSPYISPSPSSPPGERLLIQNEVSQKEENKYHIWMHIWRSRKMASDQFSRSVVSDSLRPHELQQARPPCPSPTPRVNWDSRPSSQWCHPAISSSVIPFSSCPQSLPASESSPMSQFFAWGGQYAYMHPYVSIKQSIRSYWDL